MKTYTTKFTVQMEIRVADHCLDEPIGTLEFERSQWGYVVQRLNDEDATEDGSSYQLSVEQFSGKEPEEAWSQFLDTIEYETPWVILGPGINPARLIGVHLQPVHFQVWSVGDDGTAKHAGCFLHWMEALDAARGIVSEGGSPAVLSPMIPIGPKCDSSRIVPGEPTAGELV